MTDLITTLCERLAQGLERDPDRLARELGTASVPAANGLPIRVVPNDASIASADVFADNGETSVVNLDPAERLTLSALAVVLGGYKPSARLHPHDPKKFVFSPHDEGSHPYSVRVVAYVSADEEEVDTAAVERVTIICSPATIEPVSTEPPEISVWPRLLSGRARLRLRSLRPAALATLDGVRRELEQALGYRFETSHDKVYDGAAAFECLLPACELRLNSWAAENHELTIFNFIGVPSDDLDGALPPEDDVSHELAAHLRALGRDWYVPSPEEMRDGAGTLGAKILEQETIVATLTPRWLGWFDGDERDAGLRLLQGIAELWLSAARRAPDPIADVRRRKTHFQGWGRNAPPRSRLRLLFSYFVQAQLTVIEEQLLEMQDLTTAELAAVPKLGARLAEWQELASGLEEAARDTLVESIREQRVEVLAAIDGLTKKLTDATTRS